MKKLISMILAAVLLLTLATGCGSGQTNTSAQNEKGTSQTAKPDNAFAGSEKKYSKKLVIDWASVMVNEGTDYNADEFSRQWCEKFNIEWNMIPLTWENWAEKLRIWINSGDMPDIATWNYVHGELAAYVEQGLIRRLPDDWKTRWPNVAKAYESTVIGPKLDELFGGTYCLPKPRFAMNKPAEVLPDHMGIYMRKDWMEQIGIEIKDAYTVNELLDIARQIKQKDPGNVGDKLAPIEVRTGNMAFLFTWAVYEHSREPADFYIGEDGKYHWGPADPETLEGLKLYQQAYREGLLHPEFYTLKQNEDLEDFYVAGTAAITCEGGLSYYQNLFGEQFKKNLGLDPEKAMHFAAVLGNDGKYHHPEVINFWTANIFSPDMDDEKFERIMDIFDYSCTQEGQYIIRMGIKGVDWEETSDGGFRTLMPEGQTVDSKYPSIMPLYINMLILSDDFDMINPSYPESYRNRTKRQYELRSKLSDSTTLVHTDWTSYFHDSPAKRKVAFDYATEYAQLILKEGSIEENWKAWVKEKMQVVQPVLDELNALINK
ncbi:ABC transporter substrate-binding protein [Thermoclostridium stercorarium subsp. thermolacticum DSM 2910]|uniref:ABC transporter substrate-binding protein n=1 Tax=Thermoclostridium stercorarium subsp. thermolacticum DSM 2910 TaxID=1121336 RepID=A0A1B1YBV0_THEST|nr:extracellular solute-binding protein [Thermoclostridium stercorarium]ANW98250.1 ABC transporter substrate-binding protein [Thermoclostridium stercorarium subsp. thermolacticum DSM 2910]